MPEPVYAEENGPSIHDRIYLGEGLFETLRVADFTPCFAELHWQRLSQSAAFLGFDFSMALLQWETILNQRIAQDKLEDGGLKIILTGGIAARGLTAEGKNSQLLLQSFNVLRQTKPLRLFTAPWLRDSDNPLYGIKSVNYLEAILARRQAKAEGFDEVLFYNTRHQATETSCANLFIIREESLLTPPLSEGVLPGITRQRLINFCLEHAIPCTETVITRLDLQKADAVFITNSLQGIQPVLSVDNLGFNPEHPLLRALMADFL